MSAQSLPSAPGVLPRVAKPTALWGLRLFLFGAGGAMAVVGLVLLGNLTWIKSDGLLAGGVALLVTAPFVRTMLDPLVVSTPFMFYALSPIGGILTVGSSDVVLPVLLAVVVVGQLTASGLAAASQPAVPGARAMLVLSVLLAVGSTTWWSIADPDFLLSRAVADAVKLGIGIVYLVLVVWLVRRAGLPDAVRALRVWGWVATALSVGSLSGVTGAVTVIPSDGYRSLGYFEDPNLYAGFLLVSLSVILFLTTLEPSPVQAVQALVIVGGILTTGSRGGLMSLAVLVAFVAVLIDSAKVRLGIVALSACATGAIAWVFANRDNGLTVLGMDRLFAASEQVGEDPRLALWGLAVEKWLDAPLWGIGLGQFERFSGNVFRVQQSTGLGYVTHNSFLFFLVAFGVIGLGLFLFFLGWLTVHLYRSRLLDRRAKHALASGLLVIVSQMMTLNLQNLRYVWIYFGMVLGIALLGAKEEDSSSPSAGSQTCGLDRGWNRVTEQ